MNFNKVFKAYDSRYLSRYNYAKKLCDKGVYNSFKLSLDDLIKIFEGEY